MYRAGVFLVVGRDLVIFARTFAEFRSAWLPVQAVVKESSIASRAARSSGNSRAAPSQITLVTVVAMVHYRLNERTYDVAASGWEERYRTFSRWEQFGLEAGRAVAIRVRPDDPDHATLLGEWTPPSVVPFGRYIATEILVLCALIVCGKFIILPRRYA
ncbi:MAG TPA: DUF3592 domain-containing protein [Steroidobacteraceae bacterium]